MENSAIAIAKVNQFKTVLNSASIKAQVKNSMRENAGAFLSSMLDLYTNDKSLQQCDPEKVAMECLKAAFLKLPISRSLGFAYVVPYKNVPTFILGYKGLIQLAQRSGQYRTINADVVYEGELLGFDKLSGRIDLSGERTGDKVEGYFAYFQLINGFEKTVYMSREQMDEHVKKYSQSAKSSYSPWMTEYDEMGKKTVLRRLISKYGIMSVEMQNALVDEGISSVSREVQREAEVEANKEVIDTSATEPAEPEEKKEKAREVPAEGPGF